ncbi:hypothetical protein CYMTET_12674, partial [Cymbomonas tetramitiformis]
YGPEIRKIGEVMLTRRPTDDFEDTRYSPIGYAKFREKMSSISYLKLNQATLGPEQQAELRELGVFQSSFAKLKSDLVILGNRHAFQNGKHPEGWKGYRIVMIQNTLCELVDYLDPPVRTDPFHIDDNGLGEGRGLTALSWRVEYSEEVAGFALCEQCSVEELHPLCQGNRNCMRVHALGRRPIPLRLLRDGDGRPCERTMQPGCLYYDTMASGMKDTWQVQPLSRISVTEWKLWVAELESVDEKERTALGAEPSPNVGKTEQRERDGDAEREARRRILCRQTSRIHLVPDSCPSALPNWSVEELERSLHLSAQERHLFTIRNQVMLSRQHWDVAFMERFEGLLQMSTMRNVAERRTSWWRKMIGILSGEPAPDLDIDSWDYYSMLGRPSSGKQKKKERERMELAYRSRLLERLEELDWNEGKLARWDQLKAHGRLALNAKKDVKEGPLDEQLAKEIQEQITEERKFIAKSKLFFGTTHKPRKTSLHNPTDRHHQMGDPSTSKPPIAAVSANVAENRLPSNKILPLSAQDV